jgi:hypothetical protein
MPSCRNLILLFRFLFRGRWLFSKIYSDMHSAAAYLYLGHLYSNCNTHLTHLSPQKNITIHRRYLTALSKFSPRVMCFTCVYQCSKRNALTVQYVHEIDKLFCLTLSSSGIQWIMVEVANGNRRRLPRTHVLSFEAVRKADFLSG